MQDKDLMQDILMLEKGVCDLYMHGSIEASTKNINQTFKSALNESLCMQESLYSNMAQKGWYTAEQADKTKVDTLRQKFTNATC